MYRRSLKRYAFGDYYNQEGNLEGNRITDVAQYGNLAAGLTNTVDPGNKFGVKSSFGAGFSSAASGAAAGAAFGPWGAVAGAGVGLVTGLVGNKKAKEAQAEAEKQERIMKLDKINKYSKGVLSTYPSFGIMEAKYGMKLPMFPAGGKLPYPTDGSEVEQLASNVAVYNGETHENGGIDLDTNQDGSPEIEVEDSEVIKDDMVLSDRIKPSAGIKSFLKGLKVNFKDNDTYASIAERLAKKKGEFEKNLNSSRIGEAGTAKLMTERYDEAIDVLFQDQQAMKIQNNIGEYRYGGKMKYQFGGEVNPDPTKPGKRAAKKEVIDELKKEFQSDANTFVEEGQVFNSKADYDKYFTDLAVNKLSPEDKAFYEGILSGDNKNISAEGYIGLKAPYVPYNVYLKTHKKVTGKNLSGTPDAPYGNVTGRAYGVMNYGGYLPSTIPSKKGYFIGNDVMPLKKFAFGDLFSGVNSFNNQLELQKKYKLEGIYPSDNNDMNTNSNIDTSVPPTLPQDKISFGEKLESNLGNIATGVGFLANQAQINRLETQYKPTLAKNPVYNFTSRLPYLSGQIKSAFNTASTGIRGSSAQDNNALKANLFAKTLNELNRATGDEFAREDAYKARFNEMVAGTDRFNTQTVNQASFASMDNRNQRRSLTQKNVDALLRGVQGNVAMKQSRELDFMKNKIELAKAGDKGIDERFLKSLTPKERRTYFGKYN